MSDGNSCIDCVIVDDVNDSCDFTTNTSKKSVCLADRCALYRVLKFVCVVEKQLNQHEEHDIWSYLVISLDDLKLLKRVSDSNPVSMLLFGCDETEIWKKNSIVGTNLTSVKDVPRTKKLKTVESPKNETIKYFFVSQKHAVQFDFQKDCATCNVSAYILEDNSFTEVHLRFKRKTMKWVPFIHPGSLIKVVEQRRNSCEIIPESCQFTKAYVIPDKCNISHVHDFSVYAFPQCLQDVKYKWKDSFYGKLYNTCLNVEEVNVNKNSLTNNCCTVIGILTIRSAYKDEVSFERRLCYRIDIKDVNTDFTMSIYFKDLLKFQFMSGLVPRAVVKFQGIRIMTSRGGKAYGKFLPSSKVLMSKFVTDSFKTGSIETKIMGNETVDDKEDASSIKSENNEEIPCFSGIGIQKMIDECAVPVSQILNAEQTYIMHLYDGCDKSVPESNFKLTVSVTKVYVFRLSFKCKQCLQPPMGLTHKSESCYKHMFKRSLLNYDTVNMEFVAKCLVTDGTGNLNVHFDAPYFNMFAKIVNWAPEIANDVKDFAFQNQSGSIVYQYFNDNQNMGEFDKVLFIFFNDQIVFIIT